MFKTLFNFNGRIRRTEYGISVIVFLVCFQLIESITEHFPSLEIFNLILIPLFWFIAAQGVKRCHDNGHAGWFQIIPFYFFLLLFLNGNQFENEYGLNPKEKMKTVI
jgi:uncharacterized membrane protein YhaH (DUF805 family)